MKKIKYISAGVGERMQYVAHKYNDTTIRFLLHYPGILDPDTLCAATKAVIEGVEVLHASFVAKSRRSLWGVHTEYGASEYFALMECDGNPMKPAQSVALKGIGHRDKCQMHVTLVRGTNSCAVVVRISHLVTDGSDGKYLLNKLAESYRLLEQTGTTAALEIKNGSRSAANAYSELNIKELASLAKTPFSDVKTMYSFADDNAHGVLRMLRCTIPAEVLTEARKKAKAEAEAATVNDVLLTALYRSYAKVTGCEGRMSISSMMDLRSHCKDGISEGLSNMSGGLGTTLEVVQGNSFKNDLKCIAEQTEAAKSDPLSGLAGIPLLHMATKTLPMWLLLQAADMVYSSMSLNFTNLGNIPCEPLAMAGLKPTEGIFGGPLKRKPSVQVGTASFDGTAELTILGDFMTEDVEPLQRMLNGTYEEICLYLEEEA